MSRSIVAKRYARALFEAAVDEKIVGEVEKELKLVVTIINENDDIRKFLEHPNIEGSSKIAVLKNTLEKHISPIVFNTLQLIISRGRESMLPSLLEYYVSIANAALGQANAIVYSAFELSAEEEAQIAKTFSAISGKKIQVESVVDKNILGGLRVRIGDSLYDGSLATKLVKLEKSLMKKAL